MFISPFNNKHKRLADFLNLDNQSRLFKKDILFLILLIAIFPKDDDDRDEVGVVDGSADGERRRYFSKVKSFSFTGFKMTSNAV